MLNIITEDSDEDQNDDDDEVEGVIPDDIEDNPNFGIGWTINNIVDQAPPPRSKPPEVKLPKFSTTELLTGLSK